MKYLLGCCTNIDCSEFGGGWKYKLDYPIQEQEESYCPGCGENTFTTFWRGYVVILNPEQSEIAQKMGITKKGKYALRLSR